MSEDDLDDLVELTPNLTSLGWTAALERWAEEVEQRLVGDADQPGAAAGLVRGRLARVDRGFSLIFTGGDAVLAASGSGRAGRGEAPATGDFVVISDDPEDGPIVAAIAERTSALRRRAPGRVPEPQVLAANADAVFVMHGLDRPLNLRRLERQLVVAWDSGAQPVVVLTKADLVDDPSDAIAEAAAVAPAVEVIEVSTVDERGVARLGRYFDGHRAVALLGPSGIGKSSLVNVLSAGVVQRIGEVRANDRRGRHTTVTRDLIPLPGGGFVIDAPGVREIGLWQAYEGLDLAFAEIAEAARTCRFGDCEHGAEPGCGVRAGLDDGTIATRRVDHWRELQAELALQESQLEEFARRSESRDRASAEDDRDSARSTRRSRSRRSESSRGDRSSARRRRGDGRRR